MEFAVYFFFTALCAVAIHWAGRNAGRRPGTPLTGFFRYRDADDAAATAKHQRALTEPGRWHGTR
jgi:hypothetical protein